jgi:hypothetical protein
VLKTLVSTRTTHIENFKKVCMISLSRPPAIITSRLLAECILETNYAEKGATAGMRESKISSGKFD